MKHEFKKIKSQDETRYVLETASAGGTSSGAVASVSGPLGKVRRRDNLLAQEDDGISKDKETKFHAKLDKLVHNTFGKRKGEMEELDQPDHEISMASSELASVIEDATRLLAIIRRYSEMEGLEAWQQSKITKAADYLNAVLNNLQGKEVFNKEDHSGFNNGWGQNSYDTYAGGNHGRGVAEVAPKGWEKTVKAMKKHKDIDNPWALANWMKNKGYKSHKDESVFNEASLAELQNEFNFSFDPKRLSLLVSPKDAGEPSFDNAIAWIGLDYAGKTPDGGRMYSSSDTMVQPKYQRRGIATAMYQYLRQQGINVVSSDEQTDKGAAMWQAFRKKGLAKDNNFLEDPYTESLASMMAEKLDPNADVDVWVQDFQKADPNRYHQFRNKTPEKKARMAVAARYAAKNPSKK